MALERIYSAYFFRTHFETFAHCGTATAMGMAMGIHHRWQNPMDMDSASLFSLHFVRLLLRDSDEGLGRVLSCLLTFVFFSRRHDSGPASLRSPNP